MASGRSVHGSYIGGRARATTTGASPSLNLITSSSSTKTTTVTVAPTLDRSTKPTTYTSTSVYVPAPSINRTTKPTFVSTSSLSPTPTPTTVTSTSSKTFGGGHQRTLSSPSVPVSNAVYSSYSTPTKTTTTTVVSTPTTKFSLAPMPVSAPSPTPSLGLVKRSAPTISVSSPSISATPKSTFTSTPTPSSTFSHSPSKSSYVPAPSSASTTTHVSPVARKGSRIGFQSPALFEPSKPVSTPTLQSMPASSLSPRGPSTAPFGPSKTTQSSPSLSYGICSGCGQTITKGDYIDAGSLKFHDACFKCASCRKPFSPSVGGRPTVRPGEKTAVCERCAEAVNAASAAQGGGGGSKTLKGEAALMEYCKKRLGTNQLYTSKGVQIRDFTLSWKDGLAFCALAHSFNPSLIPNFGSLSTQSNNDQLRNVRLAFSAFTKMGVPELIEPEDIVFAVPSPEPKSVMTYLSTIIQTLDKK